MADDFKIDTHIPIPTRDGRTLGRLARYPWCRMEVGHSILFTGDEEECGPSSAYAYGKRHGWKFTQKRMGDGVRVWRIK